MRLFVAVYLPPDLQELVWKIGSLVEGAWKREPPEKLHITLKYLGEVQEDRIEEVVKVLEGLKSDPFQVSIRGVGAFPTLTNPRVIWVGVEDPSGKLKKFAEYLNEEFYKLGIPREWREYVPHVTLGRAKGKVNIDKLVERHRRTYFGSFTVYRISLVRSFLTPSGSIYKVVRSFDIKD